MYKVYVVEDSPPIREAITFSLESSGQIAVIGHAECSADAWSDVRLHSAQAVIVDLALRHGSGFELLQKLNTAPHCAKMAKIVLTNYATRIVRQRALALGASHFFDKSFEFEQVVELLHELALSHHTRDNNSIGPREMP